MDPTRKMGLEPQGGGSSRLILGHAASLSQIDVSTQADIHHVAASYESEDETMGRRNKVGGSDIGQQRNKRGTPLYSKEDIREQYCITDKQLDVLEKARGGGGGGNGSTGGFFGCLSNYQDSPCGTSRTSLLSVCVRRKAPSDENLHELYRRQPADYAPIPRYPRYPFSAPPPAELYQYDENLDCSYFRRRPRSFCNVSDPKRYTWMPEDEESVRMERPRPIRADLDEYDVGVPPRSMVMRPASRQSTISGGSVQGMMPHHPHYLSYSSEYLPAVHGAPPPGLYMCPAHPDLPPPPPPPPALIHHDGITVHRTKHVSFARSHTLTSFDDTRVPYVARSQERLLDGKKTADPVPISRQGDGSESPKIVVLEKVKRAPMKTQATQTEVCLGRKPLPPSQLSLSPRTIQRVKMVSQGAQTNGNLNNGRKLTKSYSEAGSRFGVSPVSSPQTKQFVFGTDQPHLLETHEPLQRTQSEEPPKSPFIIPTPPPSSPSKTSGKESDRSEVDESDSDLKSQKEIIIDFEPQISPEPIERPKKKVLLKTMSEGEILQERRKSQITDEELIIDGPFIMSTSQENIKSEPEPTRSFTPYFLNSPILNEGIYKGPPSSVYSPVLSRAADGVVRMQDSVDEEFHEHYICGGLFRKRSVSLEDGVSSTSDSVERTAVKSAPSSPGTEIEGRPESKSEEDGVVPTSSLFTEKTNSPFASSDSLANDLRDHSDGIWNESQATVLQAADSGTENGTMMSTSDLSSLTAVSPSATLLTPSSRRKHLLMLQHQQRSSMDTDALDEEFQPDQTQIQPPSPRTKKEPVVISHPPMPPPPSIAVTTPPEKPPESTSICGAVPPVSVPPPTRKSTGGRGELRRRRSPVVRTPDLTPSETPHRSLDSPDNGGKPLVQTAAELLLTRNDSGKTTDISESTTTTDDYVTANSDSSRKSSSLPGTSTQSTHGSQTGTQDGSSFESASSVYSLARGEAISEDMVVPSFTPPPILEESTSDTPVSPVPEQKKPTQTPPLQEKQQRRASSKEPTSPSGTSSSSGSYSLNGSVGDLDQTKDQRSKVEQQRPTVPSPRHAQKGESLSDDDRSAHYSSSGYYESPVDEFEDDANRPKVLRRSSDRREWTEEEKRRKKKGFTLEFSRRGEDALSPESHKVVKTEEMKYREKRSPSGLTPSEQVEGKEKIKRQKSRSPVRSLRKSNQAGSVVTSGQYQLKKGEKELTSPGMVRSPPMRDGFRPDEWPTTKTSPHEDKIPLTPQIATTAGTSDESSGGIYHVDGSEVQQTSPRKHRRVREAPRRKSGPNLVCSRSPTSTNHRIRRRSGSIEDKTVSLPGSLPRRRSSMQPKSTLEPEEPPNGLTKGARLSPHRYPRSPGGSPRKIRSPKSGIEVSPDVPKIKSLSAESLRSVSPGSDSVFYSESGSNTATITDQHQCVHCLHCGKEVDIVTTDDLDEGADAKDQPDIVRPPAGFADSPDGPRTKHSTGRLYKKLDKRFRSEERSHANRRHHHRYRQDVRAKSEERGKDENNRIKLRPLARSTDASLEILKATASSPSVTTEEEDDAGIYVDSYKSGIWIFIGDTDEMHVWHKPDTPKMSIDDEEGHSASEEQESSAAPKERRDSAESAASTSSEHEFRKRYQCVTHRMVHRKSCLEMYKRQAIKTFAAPDTSTDDEDAGSLRKTLEDLFKLMLLVWCKESQACKIVSSEPNESDKTVIVRRECGEFGFRIHGSKPVVVSAIEPDTPAETSGLEVGDIVISVNGVNVLDKSHSEVVKIAHAGSDTLELEVARTCDVLAPGGAEPGGGDALYSGYLWKFTTNNNKWVKRWFCLKRDNCLYYYKTETETQPVGALMLINYKINRTPECGRADGFSITKPKSTGLQLAADTEEAATRWVAVIAHAIERSSAADTWLETTKRNLRIAPTLLPKPDCFGYLMKLGSKWKAWNKRYCVLKDACLYFYQDANSKNAFGMTCLHGYRVQQATPGGKKHAFEVIPPDPSQRHLFFYTESDLDRKRWLAALEYSIDRWLRVG